VSEHRKLPKSYEWWPGSKCSSAHLGASAAVASAPSAMLGNPGGTHSTHKLKEGVAVPVLLALLATENPEAAANLRNRQASRVLTTPAPWSERDSMTSSITFAQECPYIIS